MKAQSPTVNPNLAINGGSNLNKKKKGGKKMKSGTYYLLGLIILSLVFMASNSSAQPSIPSPYSNILIQRALPPPPVGWSFPSNSFAQPSIPSPYSTTIQRALPSSPAGGSLQGGYSRPTASVGDTGAAGQRFRVQPGLRKEII